MFDPYHTFEIDELRPGKQDMCCMKIMYCPGLSRIDSSGGKVPIIDIYVRCYITRINNDLYMATFCERSLGFSNKFYVRIFNRKNLPSFYRLPILWALTNNVLTFKEDGRVDFVKNLEGKVLKTIDIFNEQDCIDRITYVELCKKNHCESV